MPGLKRKADSAFFTAHLPHNFAAQYIRSVLFAEIRLPWFVAFAQPDGTVCASALQRN
jgi:hypothetical protein